MRVVATTCSNTEIVCALGCASFLVGVDRHSDYPPEVVDPLPKVGPDLGVDPDLVAALEPDLVLASLTVPGHDAVVESLEARGLRVVAPAPRSLEDVYDDVRTIAELLGVAERAESVVAEMQAAIQPRPERSAADRPAILVEWWPKPVIVPGRQSWVTDLIELAGGVNPWGGAPVESQPVEPDAVGDANPDAVVIAWCGVQPDKYRTEVVFEREWPNVRATREGHVYPIAEAFLGRPGPRLVDGYRELCAVVDRVLASRSE